MKIVENKRGLTFRHPVAVRFLPAAEFEKDVRSDESDLDAKERKQIEQSTGLLRALGLLSGDVDLFKAFDDAHGEGTLAYYSFEDQRITVRGKTLKPSVRATLVHELTHALQDQAFAIGDRRKQLAKADEKGATTTESPCSTRSPRAMPSGSRRSTATRSRRSSAAHSTGRQDEADRADKSLGDVPKVVLTMISSPYTLGEAMVQAVAEDGGNAAVDRLFRDTPEHEAVLLDPFEILAGDVGASQVEVPKPQEGEERFDSGEFGALTWYFMLAERLPILDALHATDGWGGDGYLAFERGGTSCARVEYSGRTSGATRDMYVALTHWAAAGPRGAAKAVMDGSRVLFESCDPGTEVKVGNDVSTRALELATVRTYLGVGILHAGAPQELARCVAGRLVGAYPLAKLEDPTFGANDPAVKARVQKMAAGCRGSQ